MGLRGQVAIVGAADTEVGRLPDKGATQLAVEAALGAIRDAGLEKSAIDGLITCQSMAEPYLYHGEAVAEYLQIFPRFCQTANAGGGTTLHCIYQGAMAIQSGLCQTVLITMADSLKSGLSRKQAMAMQASSGHPQFERPYGPTVPAYYALIAQAHRHQYGTTSEQLAAVAVTCRDHARLNPRAQMRKPLSIADVVESPLIADPLHLYDCSLVSDGGAAIVLTGGQRAFDFPQPPVFLHGYGEGHSHEHISQCHSLVQSAAKISGERAYAMAGVGPKDMDFAELYDCFTPTVVIELEDLGFCQKGEGGAFAASGELSLSGSLPINTHGGLLSHSHPGNPGSLFAVTEAVSQLRHQSGERQVRNAQIGLVHALGGIMSSHGTLILGREQKL